MGPCALFDKSFLQSLSLDESVWFDNFFMANVCPLFYVETLGDLGKNGSKGRTPEREVEIIASKFPQVNGVPNIHHTQLALGNLMGNPVVMDGRPCLAGGRRIETGGQKGVRFEPSPEAEAFRRWKEGDFHGLERQFAHNWRVGLNSTDLSGIAEGFKAIGVTGKTCKTLADAAALAQSIANGEEHGHHRLRLAVSFLGIPAYHHQAIVKRWHDYGRRPLQTHAPYAAYVLKVDAFFRIALAANLIASNRVSNRQDIAYLYYLPFCRLFISSDRLHERCAQLFLREDQEFVWGQDLKEDFRKLNASYSILSEETREKGIGHFASTPPIDEGFLVTSLWDQFFPNWRRESHAASDSVSSSTQNEVLAKLSKILAAPEIRQGDSVAAKVNPDFISAQKTVLRRKGSWWQVPKDLDSEHSTE